MADKPFRVLPAVTDTNRHFWTGGAGGELRFLRCQDCRYYVHPPTPICPICLSKDLAPEAVSGRATVHSVTVNHQPWLPGFDPPYAIAIVDIEEQEGLRLTTNIVGCGPDDVEVGMPVRVTFEEYDDDVWLPLFEPYDGADAQPPEPVPASRPAFRRRTEPAVRAPVGERAAVITGIGQSQIGRRIGRDPLDLTIDACLAAIEDAGLTRADIDGISTYPGPMGTPPGFSGAGVVDLQDALRLDLDWYASGVETSGQLGSVITACAAISAGLVRHVLCFRSVWEATAQGTGGRGPTLGGGGEGFKASGFMQWTLPFGAASAANWIGLMAQRHFSEYGTTREQLAQIALNGRKNAALNPNAIYTDPMSMEDYFDARMISSPLCLYDCDVPADGATAFIVSRADAALDVAKPPIAVEAAGSAIWGRPSWDQWDDLTTMPMRDAGSMLWTRTDLTPSDVDVAECYDGFSFITLAWLEALGFCGKGESGSFIEGGERIALDGELPLNTHGGQLSAGRLHGYGFLHEACVQLWGEGGDRQVQGDPEVAVAAAGGGPTCGCLLLTRSR